MWLTVRTGEYSGTSVEVTGEEFVLGRDEGCDLVLPGDSKVSRRHARLAVGPDGHVQVEDLGSTNGLLLNGRRVRFAALGGRDQIQLGDTVVVATRDAPLASGNGTQVGALTVAGARGQSAVQRLLLRRSRRALVLSGGAAAVAVVFAALFATNVLTPGSASTREAVQNVVRRAGPGTVLIESQQGRGKVETGTGWVLDGSRGLVVTNFHVVNGGETFRVSVGDDVFRGELLAAAPCEDLALLRLVGAHSLPTLSLGDQSSLEQGEPVVALGYPANASQEAALTSTTGVVSIARSAYREATLDVPRYPNVIQTDAAINPGNSGGPLLDLDGKVIGVSAAGRTLSPDGRIIQGQSYAIGIDRVKQVLGILRGGKSIGWPGIGFDYLTPKELDDRGLRTGIVVSAAFPGSGAAAAGMAKGSVFVAVNGIPVSNSLASYCDAVTGVSSGEPVRFTVLGPGAARTKDLLVAMR
jgi:S1-C subfamily serine protease